jgi:hypothetical protein
LDFVKQVAFSISELGIVLIVFDVVLAIVKSP